MNRRDMTPDWGRDQIGRIKQQLEKRLFGIGGAIDNLLIGFFSLIPYSRGRRKELGHGHVLLMAPPGYGKTDMMQGIAAAVSGKFSFIAGHPEMKVSEIMGGDIYEPSSGSFFFHRGPIFANLVLIDEINRIHPKPQALTLQAMEERTAFVNTIDTQTHRMENKILPLYPISEDPGEQGLCFWVVASGNPFEQEGTYSLPEAQLDRFTICFGIDLPSEEDEMKIRLENVYTQKDAPEIQTVMDLTTAVEVARLTTAVKFEQSVSRYMGRVIHNSRPRPNRERYAKPSFLRFIDDYIKAGLSPRADYHFQAVARTLAFINGNDFVSVDDVKAAARLVMPHRILIEHRGKTKKIKSPDVVEEILKNTILP